MGDEVISSRDTLLEVCDRLPVLTFPGGSHRFDHLEELVGLVKSDPG